MLSKKVKLGTIPQEQRSHALAFGSRMVTEPVPKYRMPEHSMPGDVAYQIIHDELNLDGNPALNLASFVTTWMEPEARRLMIETVDKNYVDQDEYPQTTEIQNRCVNMLAHLLHAPDDQGGVGTATVGSSEAIHLAGLALKWNWRKRRRARGKPADRPNLVMGQNVQVCWEKFARYFEVEPRYVPLTTQRFVLGVPEALELIDENTIAVVGISWAAPTRANTSRSRNSTRRWRSSTGRPVWTCRSTSTRPAAASWPRSPRPNCPGTSGCRECGRSTCPGTSTAWSTRAWAGSSGAPRRTCPRS